VAASQRSAVDPFYVMEVAKAAAARQASHGDVIPLFVGQPATPAPVVAREAAARAVVEDVLGYTVTNGIPELRTAIAREYRRRRPGRGRDHHGLVGWVPAGRSGRVRRR
jgi:aspartate/methionine/tyrosine aminotransferase